MAFRCEVFGHSINDDFGSRQQLRLLLVLLSWAVIQACLGVRPRLRMQVSHFALDVRMGNHASYEGLEHCNEQAKA
jgi:hypothetical protein